MTPKPLELEALKFLVVPARSRSTIPLKSDCGFWKSMPYQQYERPCLERTKTGDSTIRPNIYPLVIVSQQLLFDTLFGMQELCCRILLFRRPLTTSLHLVLYTTYIMHVLVHVQCGFSVLEMYLKQILFLNGSTEGFH